MSGLKHSTRVSNSHVRKRWEESEEFNTSESLYGVRRKV